MNINNVQQNRLSKEKSPYLLQHANNPVDWYAWSEEAFERARQESKPILLSIGYSACHWCHVMAHESFENDITATLMNDLFVNIKVDREEYPDVDHLYQTFVQMTTGRGGWPLTVFLTPDKVPFYGGTYFPAKPGYGIISFPELLKKIHDIYQNNPDKIAQSVSEVQKILYSLPHEKIPGNLPDPEKSFSRFYQILKNSFDDTYGGFSKAPKFPHVADMKFLLQYYHYEDEKLAKDMVLFTLRKMAMGGIYDQFGGGFHRYSTDEKWLVPHFEKMLYDNALSIPLYVDAFRLTSDVFFKNIALETADFILRELTDDEGAFYSTLDADSEGEEGKYYLWDYQEVQKIVDPDLQNIFCEYYGLTPAGNFAGKNIPYMNRSFESLIRNYQMNKVKTFRRFQDYKKELYKNRIKRVKPDLDNKILTDWNGMMISALWTVYQLTGKQNYYEAAKKAIQYIQKYRLNEDSSLSHFIKNNDEKILGYIDDYAYFIQALIDGFETVQDQDYLNLAVRLSHYTLNSFWDAKKGGFYFTDMNADTTLVRLKQKYDSSTPAGNNIMCLNLLRLGYYTGNKEFAARAEDIFRLFQNDLENRGYGIASLLSAFIFYYFSPLEITVSGKKALKPEIFEKLFQLFVPHKILVHYHPNLNKTLVSPDLIGNRENPSGSAVFICYRGSCSLPLESQSQIVKILQSLSLNIQ
jgi:uncharacterized protein YyaL (SSP411 family)